MFPINFLSIIHYDWFQPVMVGSFGVIGQEKQGTQFVELKSMSVIKCSHNFCLHSAEILPQYSS